MLERFSHNRAKHELHRQKDGVEGFLDADIPEEFKTLALLTYTGAKPFSTLDLPYREDCMERIAKIREALSSLAIPHSESILSSHRGERIEFNMARDAETLERARVLRDQPDEAHGRFSEQWHREFGTLLGFPTTAVEAFVRHQPLLRQLPDEVRHTDIGKFYDNVVMMRLSEAHWKQELKALEKWMEAIRSVSPEYVEYLISDENRARGGAM